MRNSVAAAVTAVHNQGLRVPSRQVVSSTLARSLVATACLLYLAVGWLKRLTRHLLEHNHASEADGQFEEVDKQGDQFAVADAVATVQERHVSGQARAKGAGRDVVGARCGHLALTARAAHTEVLVSGDLGHDDGKVPDLLTLRRPKGGPQFREGQLKGGQPVGRNSMMRDTFSVGTSSRC